MIGVCEAMARSTVRMMPNASGTTSTQKISSMRNYKGACFRAEILEAGDGALLASALGRLRGLGE